MNERLKKLKIMNFRPCVVLAVFMMLAIFCAVFVSNNARLVLFVIFISMFGIALTICCVLKKKFILMVAAVCLVFATAFGFVYAKNQTLKGYQNYAGEGVYVYAKIAEKPKFSSSGSLVINLTDVQVKTDSGYDLLRGNISLYTNPKNLDLTELCVGRYIMAKTNLTVFDLSGNVSDNKRAVSFLSGGVIGYAYSPYYNIKPTENYKMGARDFVYSNIRNSLKSADLEYADLGFTMLFGESAYLDETVKAEFRSTGIAHLLAVSGLHFSIIFMIISAISKYSKANKKSSLFVQAVIIFLYAYLCNFSVSVIRAGVMAFIVSYAKIRHKAYDNLSALSLIAFIILCVNPFKLFNISFVLSFIAVFSILMLSPIFKTFFSKIFEDKMASTLSLNVAVQIGMLAINIYYFGRYAIFSGIINFLLIPIATAAFGILFVSVLLSSAFPVAIYLSKGFDFLIDIVVKINSYFSSTGVYLKIGSLSIVPVILILVTMVLASEYTFTKKRNRLIVVSSFTILSGLAFLL